MKSELEKLFRDEFKAWFENAEKHLPQNIKTLKLAAIDDFAAKGLPVKGTEDWKYTDLVSAMSPEYKHQLNRPHFDYKIEDIFRCDVPDLESDTLLTVNGWYSDESKLLNVYENGVIAGSFAEALNRYPELVLQEYTKIADPHGEALVRLNTALASDGIFIYIPKGVVVEKPIQVIDIVSGAEDVFVHRRNLFIVEENASAHIVVCDHSLTFNKSFSNSVTEIKAHPRSVLNLTRIQNSSNNSAKATNVYVEQKKNSTVTLNTLTLHGGFVRNNIKVELQEENSENNLYGIYLTDRTQHVDNHTLVHHIASDCTSNQKYKGILDEKSHAVFSGKILVARDAQRTQAFQANNNLQLTDEATVNSKPQLEIYADDVKCSHGATVGQLDNDALFYLQARGIHFEEARMLLMQAFANEVVQKISVEALRTRIEDMVTKRLRGELSRCNHCVINCC